MGGQVKTQHKGKIASVMRIFIAISGLVGGRDMSTLVNEDEKWWAVATGFPLIMM